MWIQRVINAPCLKLSLGVYRTTYLDCHIFKVFSGFIFLCLIFILSNLALFEIKFSKNISPLHSIVNYINLKSLTAQNLSNPHEIGGTKNYLTTACINDSWFNWEFLSLISSLICFASHDTALSSGCKQDTNACKYTINSREHISSTIYLG